MTDVAEAIRAKAREAPRLKVEREANPAENGKRPEQGVRDFTHDGLALDLGDWWQGKVKHVAAWGQWLFWKGSIWREDETLEHMTAARQFLRSLAETLGEDSKATKKKLRSAHTVARVLSLARSNEAQVATVDQWDADPYQLGHPTPEEP